MKHKLLLSFCLIFNLLISGCSQTETIKMDVTLEGGSGKASIQSPCTVTIQNGQAEALITWSSPHYDYMIVNNKKYKPVNTKGNSQFQIPVAKFDKPIKVKADTTAMSKPYLIDYTLIFHRHTKAKRTKESSKETVKADVSSPPQINGLTYVSTDTNAYANNYAIHRYKDGYIVLSINDGRNYLIVPEGQKAVKTDCIVLRQPLNRVYLAATNVMSEFASMDALNDVWFTSMQADDWKVDAAKEAMKKGSIQYGGNYRSPDYEQLIDQKVNLAIENTMILHVPKVLEKLEKMGIPVFIDRSSYESEPLGRSEWIKVYGVLTNHEEQAHQAFESQAAKVHKYNNTGLKVAVFSINANGQIYTKKKDDYLVKMIEQAGGTYVDLDTDTTSMETFYTAAKDADILIYNAAIESSPKSIDALIEQEPLFKDFKAVQNKQVWIMDASMFQHPDEAGTIIQNIHELLTDDTVDTDYFHPLKEHT